jgi:exosome complex RNA-binding protein Rrp4
MLVTVDWKLIKRIKKHFLKIHQINIILAHNGNIWLSYDPYTTLDNP